MNREQNRRQKRLVVVGAGASGLAAAISAARMGCAVQILEAEDRPGKKILATGNGKCNYTNSSLAPEKYRSDGMDILQQILKQFTWQEAVAWMKDIGIWPTQREGYFYPASGQAASVAECLLLEAKRLSVEIHTNTAVTGIKKKQCFRIETKEGTVYEADAVILSAGTFAGLRGKSYPDGMGLAQGLKLKLQTPVPALTALKGDGRFRTSGYGKLWNGVRVHASVGLYAGKVLQAEDCGEVQLTEYGVSGIPVFQVSRFASYALLRKQPVKLVLDLMPTLTEEALGEELLRRSCMEGRNAREQLSGLWNAKLAAVLLKAVQLSAERPLQKGHCTMLAQMAKAFPVGIAGTNSLEQSQVCAGGVLLSEINSTTMECKTIKQLYLTGELLDADGICGGYNLHWAWTTGILAGRAAANALKGREK